MAGLKFVFVLVCFASVSAHIDTARKFRSIRESLSNQNSSGRLLGTLTAVTYDWFATIYEIPAAVGDPILNFGPGVVINKYYVIAHSSLHSSTAATSLAVAAKAAAGNAPGANAIERRVKEKIIHETIDVIDTIQLFRVCPSFAATNIYVIPATAVAYAPGDAVKFVNYVPESKEAAKTIGEDCECDTYGTDIADYKTRIVPKTFCGSGISIEAADKVGTIVVKGTNFIGINADYLKGDLFLEIAQYKTWIDGKITA